MPKIKLNMIGCGKLGKTIVKLLHQSNTVVIQGIMNSSIESTYKAIEFIGEGYPYSDIALLPSADIYMIGTPDRYIKCVAEELSQNKFLIKNSLVMHFSGAHSSDILSILKDKHSCTIASLHPVRSFPQPEKNLLDFDGTFCSLEGDKKAIIALSKLFKKIGANIFEINKDKKKLYHAASVIANNYVVTLHHQAVACFLSSGIDSEISKHLVTNLMHNALDNLKPLSHEEALTGPIQRGDVEIIKGHLHALTDEPIMIQELYKKLGLCTLQLSKQSSDKISEFKKIFEK